MLFKTKLKYNSNLSRKFKCNRIYQIHIRAMHRIEKPECNRTWPDSWFYFFTITVAQLSFMEDYCGRKKKKDSLTYTFNNIILLDPCTLSSKIICKFLTHTKIIYVQLLHLYSIPIFTVWLLKYKSTTKYCQNNNKKSQKHRRVFLFLDACILRGYISQTKKTVR